LVTLALIVMDFSNLWKLCYRLTHAFFHKVQMYVAYRYEQVTVSLELPAQMGTFNSLMQQNACYRHIKLTFENLLPCH